jgi:hypothetical protein
MRYRRPAIPENDAVSVLPGVIGAYPNAFLRVETSELPAMVTLVNQIRSAGDVSALFARYGVRQTDPAFWSFSDRPHDTLQRAQPMPEGFLDYSRLQP